MGSSGKLIAILAGEASGDLLGGELIRALRTHDDQLTFVGIGGPAMQAAGLQSDVDMERLSVMGLFEPLKRLPELLRIKSAFVEKCRVMQPDVFIGIDSPDFNLRIARELHASGIPTVHYVSPSVWAWRQKRVEKIRQCIDLMLTLFPFEEPFYRQHKVSVKFVGHPLADQLPLEADQNKYRQSLQLDHKQTCVAVLPGSRRGEVGRMLPLFLRTVQWLEHKRNDIHYLIPAANPAIRELIEKQLEKHAVAATVTVLDGCSQAVMGASDAVLLASGTSTLEALLLKRPMVMAYKLSWLTHAIVRHMVKLPYFALPNLLAGEKIVPEFIQQDAQPAALGSALLLELDDSVHRTEQQQRFLSIHQQLRQGASTSAASAVMALLREKTVLPDEHAAG